MELSDSVRQESAILDVMIENARRRTRRTRTTSWWLGYVALNVYMLWSIALVSRDPHRTSDYLFFLVTWLVGTLWMQYTRRDYIKYGPRFWMRNED